MTARATFEASCHAALTRYKQAVADGTWQVTADNALVDALLKAWEKSLRDQVIPDAEAAKLRARAMNGDNAFTQAQRRAALERSAL